MALPVVKWLRLTATGVRWAVLGKSDVGLDQVENLAPAALPVSDATATRLSTQDQTILSLSNTITSLSQALAAQQAVQDGKLGVPGAPVSRSLAFATLYQATTKTKPAVISVNVETTYTVTLAGVMEDLVEIRIGAEADKAKLVDGSGGIVVPSFRTSLTGIALTVGMSQTQRNQMLVLLPVGWYFAIRRVTGTKAVISSATDQPFG